MKYSKYITTIILCLFVVAGCKAQEGLVEEQAENELEGVPGEDNVIMKDMTIAQIVMESEQFTITESALETATMLEMFQRGEYTLVAPTDDSWEEVLDIDDFETWLEEHETPLTTILEYHVISVPITANDLKDDLTYGSVLGSPLNFDVEPDGEINVNDHEVEYVIHASNGVIYVMSEVLMPDDISNDLFE